MASTPSAHALECKAHWAAKLLNGSKTIEVRSYELPGALMHQPILLVATTGPEGQAMLGDVVDAAAAPQDAHIVCCCGGVGE